MSEINILVAVDGEKLAQQVSDGSMSAGSVDNPTNLGAWGDSDVFISMIAQHGVAVNEQGQSELTIAAQSNDIINWYITTFGNNTDYTASIYNGNFNPDGTIQVFGVSNAQENNYLATNSEPMSNDTNNNLKSVVNTFASFNAKVIEVGQTVQYTLSFILVDNNKSTNNIIGYFTWDPFIKVA